MPMHMHMHMHMLMHMHIHAHELHMHSHPRAVQCEQCREHDAARAPRPAWVAAVVTYVSCDSRSVTKSRQSGAQVRR